jgi:hypothetical protein
VALNYSNALVARSKLPFALNQAATSTVAGTVLFTWTDNPDGMDASVTDKNLLVVFNPEKIRPSHSVNLAHVPTQPGQ